VAPLLRALSMAEAAALTPLAAECAVELARGTCSAAPQADAQQLTAACTVRLALQEPHAAHALLRRWLPSVLQLTGPAVCGGALCAVAECSPDYGTPSPCPSPCLTPVLQNADAAEALQQAVEYLARANAWPDAVEAAARLARTRHARGDTAGRDVAASAWAVFRDLAVRGWAGRAESGRDLCECRRPQRHRRTWSMCKRSQRALAPGSRCTNKRLLHSARTASIEHKYLSPRQSTHVYAIAMRRIRGCASATATMSFNNRRW
jgi:hypothetical protein